jgi:hypothetical protein
VDRVGGGNDSYWTLVIEKKLIGQLILNWPIRSIALPAMVTTR